MLTYADVCLQQVESAAADKEALAVLYNRLADPTRTQTADLTAELTAQLHAARAEAQLNLSNLKTACACEDANAHASKLERERLAGELADARLELSAAREAQDERAQREELEVEAAHAGRRRAEERAAAAEGALAAAGTF